MGRAFKGFTTILLILTVIWGAAGCRFLRVDRSAESEPAGEEEGPEQTPASPSPFVALTKSITGFGSSGGVARTSKYILLSDPDGTISNGANLSGSVYEGAIAISPSEVVDIP